MPQEMFIWFLKQWHSTDLFGLKLKWSFQNIRSHASFAQNLLMASSHSVKDKFLTTAFKIRQDLAPVTSMLHSLWSSQTELLVTFWTPQTCSQLCTCSSPLLEHPSSTWHDLLTHLTNLFPNGTLPDSPWSPYSKCNQHSLFLLNSTFLQSAF